MSRKGNCYDNAPMESFWVKQEYVHHMRYRTGQEAMRKITENIAWLWQAAPTGQGGIYPLCYMNRNSLQHSRQHERSGVHNGYPGRKP